MDHHCCVGVLQSWVVLSFLKDPLDQSFKNFPNTQVGYFIIIIIQQT